MKTKILLLGTAVLTAGILNSVAGDAFLSPRAKENQVKVVSSSSQVQSSTATYVTATAPALSSPRAAANQLKQVSGIVNEVNPYLACQKMMTGSPKEVQKCADNPAMPACKPVTVAPIK